jgi:hypothetical protein
VRSHFSKKCKAKKKGTQWWRRRTGRLRDDERSGRETSRDHPKGVVGRREKQSKDEKRPSTSFASFVFFFFLSFSLEIFHRIPLVLRLLSLSGEEGKITQKKQQAL